MAVKSGRSGVPVLAGALAAADRPFLDELYSHGIRGYYDGISVHPYNEWRHPADRWQEQWRKYTLLPGIEWIREGQLAHRDDKPLWVTELGWTTDTSSRWGITEDLQAQYSAATFPILDGLPYVRAAILYELRNSGEDPAALEHNFGLVRRDFSEKPAYAAVRAALAPTVAMSAPAWSEPGTPASAPSPSEVLPANDVPVSARVIDDNVVAVGKAPANRKVRIVARTRRPRATGLPRVIRRTATSGRHGRFQRRIGRRGLRVTLQAHLVQSAKP